MNIHMGYPLYEYTYVYVYTYVKHEVKDILVSKKKRGKSVSTRHLCASQTHKRGKNVSTTHISVSSVSSAHFPLVKL